jgi:predicted GNAT family acetyltransferase
MLRICRHPDADAFLGRAGAWLLRAEDQHNLMLGLAEKLRHTPPVAAAAPAYWVTIESDAEVVGCALRTPPHKLCLTDMPIEALPALVDDVARAYRALPAVLGPDRIVRRFAALWSAARGVRTRSGMEQRIYRLDALAPVRAVPTGWLRSVDSRDTEAVVHWISAFNEETGIAVAEDPRRLADRLVAQQTLAFWMHDGPVSMAGWTAGTPYSVRIGYVYTPPDLRGRGYASACVAALSRRLLDAGLRFCVLYTDLANPTSNHIYQRIGYRPVCDVLDMVFESKSA